MITNRDRVRLVIVAVLAAAPAVASAAPAGNAAGNALSDPGDYSLAPGDTASVDRGPGAVVSSTVGSSGERGGAIALTSGPIDGTTSVFAGASAGQVRPWRHGPVLHGSDTDIGATTVGLGNSVMTLEFGAGRQGWSGR